MYVSTAHVHTALQLLWSKLSQILVLVSAIRHTVGYYGYYVGTFYGSVRIRYYKLL